MRGEMTLALVSEHRLILRMLDLVEQAARCTEAAGEIDCRFYVDAVGFIRLYADRYHHAKEEDVLFAALVKNGMPRANSPVAAMLLEHDKGRKFVADLESAVTAALAGEPGQAQIIADSALGYVALLREHIAKEDGILYPLAERILPETLRSEVLRGYQVAESHVSADFAKGYEELVTEYEEAARRLAA